MISIATMPPIDNPATAKTGDAFARMLVAISWTVAPLITGTEIVRDAESAAICGAKRRASHIIPGINKSGSLQVMRKAWHGLHTYATK